MPRGDRTGPAGAGAMSGRGAGFCAGNDGPGFMSGAFGMGMRGGAGRGRGFFGMGGGRGNRRGNFGAGRGYGAAEAPVLNEKDVLANRAKALERELGAVKERLSSIDG
ncbi:MAG: DUF5320 domain-containing protein [Kiritimatiellae bacterium]|nr:DUF5320 domain-containing protein [Kiritimatiellia bacterium]